MVFPFAFPSGSPGPVPDPSSTGTQTSFMPGRCWWHKQWQGLFLWFSLGLEGIDRGCSLSSLSLSVFSLPSGAEKREREGGGQKKDREGLGDCAMAE